MRSTDPSSRDPIHALTRTVPAVVLAALAAAVAPGCASSPSPPVSGTGAGVESDAESGVAVGSEIAAGPDAARQVVARNGLVASARSHASEAGVEVLRRGGNAVDAAVATAFAVGVVEPQMSGIGGGGSMLIWLEEEGRAEYLDFYSAKPAAPYRGLPEADSTAALRESAVPGTVAGLLAAHERFGSLPRARVMEPAIRLAEEGVPVNQTLARMIARDSAKLGEWAESRRLLWPDGEPLGPGETLHQPELAATLRTIAERGRDGFYRGPVARDVVELLNEGGNPITVDQFAGFEPEWKRPLCGDYRGRAVLSAPPPQTGHQVVHTLNLLEAHDLRALGLPTRSADAFDVLASALRVGMAANRHNTDPAWAAVPAAGLTSNAFAEARAGLVGVDSVSGEIGEGEPRAYDDRPPPAACTSFDPYGAERRAAASPGRPVDEGRPVARPGPGRGGFEGDDGGDGRGDDGGHGSFDGGHGADEGDYGGDLGGETTHLSVVDDAGNAVALTQTNSSLFGTGARVRGFFLNNSGFDFGDAEADTTPGAATPEWRTRRSTISPTIVLDGDDVRMVVGAPGGGRIPTAVVQTMVYNLDYGMDPLRAIRMPRIFPSPSEPRVQLEGGFRAETLAGARAMGYEPAALSFGYARLYMIARDGAAWIGASDPRHDGEPRGY